MTKSFADIKNLNPQKVRLGAGAPPIGIPFFWSLSAMPNTVMTEWYDMVFLKFNGATFSAATYPKLALMFPSLKLDEARGEFIRIWDDGRGVDSGRALLSAQGDAIRNITGQFAMSLQSTDNFGWLPSRGFGGVFSAASTTTDAGRGVATANTVTLGGNVGVAMDISNQVPTAYENRPRNIVFNFLVRAK